jgi:hypothetical protein
VDTAYGNKGINAGLLYFHSGIRTAYNSSLDISFQRRSNFELAENKKFKLSYQMDSSYLTGMPNVTQIRTKTKQAFDNSLLPFKIFTSFDINLQHTMFFGENKISGLNIAGRFSFSDSYTNTQVDILARPVISFPNLDKEGSKLNFALMFGYKDLANGELTRKEKRVVSFYVTVPFKVISFN